MTRTESSGHARAGLSEGRTNQKRRTQRALIEAAIALCEEGRKPTFAEVAERAMVSRGTAYRYFSSVEALIAEAMFERSVQQSQLAFDVGGDPVAAIGRAAHDFNQLLLEDEAGLHVMELSFMSVWLDNDPQTRPPRPARRLKYIDAVIEALKDELPAPARARLRHALSMVMGPEAMIALRDASGASIDDALAASSWAAQTLVRQARAEAEASHRAPAARPKPGK